MLNFRDLIQDNRVHVFDGAMGTMLYAKGIYINRCFDELNISNAKLVFDLHKEYIKAGAEIIETNSFGANIIKLAKHGLEDKLFDINKEAAKIAREAAGDNVYVAAAIGPLGIRIEPYGPTSREEAKEIFKQQVSALLTDNLVDCFILETFSDLSEVNQAIQAVRESCDLPIIAQMTIQPYGKTAFGTSPETFTTQLESWGVDVIGINCSVGPQDTLEAIQIIASMTSKKISAQPNAGLPREVDGRKMYMCSPEYMAKYAKRLIQSGVKFIGGCCGTTPEHIKLIANAVKAATPQKVERPSTTVIESNEKAVQEIPTVERSRFARKIVEGEFVTSVEIVPAKGCDPEKMLESVKQLRDAGVDAVNIPDGPRAQSRMGALATAILIQQQIGGIEPVVHYCCRDRNLLGMMSDLLGAAALGINNLLIITGDPPKMGPYPEATAVFDVDSIGLTNMVYRLNRGLDIGGNPIGRPTSFLIGVGVNPCAVDLDHEISRFAWKVDAGAQFAVTQPVFDVDQLLNFLKRIDHCRIPIIAGIWPLVSYRNAEFLSNEVPGISVPEQVLERMRKADSPEAARLEGLAIAREMLQEVRPYVQGVQVSAPFGRVPYALEVFSVL